MAVTLYVRDACPYCEAIKRELDERGVIYTEVNLSSAPAALPELIKLTRGERIVPVLVEGTTLSVAPSGGTRF